MIAHLHMNDWNMAIVEPADIFVLPCYDSEYDFIDQIA